MSVMVDLLDTNAPLSSKTPHLFIITAANTEVIVIVGVMNGSSSQTHMQVSWQKEAHMKVAIYTPKFKAKV